MQWNFLRFYVVQWFCIGLKYIIYELSALKLVVLIIIE